MNSVILTKRVLIGHRREWRTLWLKKYPVYVTMRYNYDTIEGRII